MTEKAEKIAKPSKQYMLGIRTDGPLLTKADAVVDLVSQDTTVSAFGKVTRSSVLRLALAEGLEVLAQRYSAPKDL